MSVIGTGIAAAVANTQASSKQSAKALKKDSTDQAHRARQLKDKFESHLKGVEEGEDDNASDRLHLDSQLPDSGTPFYQAPVEQEGEEDAEGSAGEKMLKDLHNKHLRSPYDQRPPETHLDIKI